MRRMIWAASVAALLAVSAAPMTASAETDAAPKAKAKAEKPVRLYGEMAVIAKEIQLTPEQQESLQAIAKERDSQYNAWRKQHTERYAKAMADSKSEDAATQKAGKDELAKYRKESTEITAPFDAKAVGLLTAEQRSQYEGAKIAASVERTFSRRKITLTDDQKAKLRELSIAQTKTLDPSDAKAARTAYMNVSKEATASVLTDEQRGQMMPSSSAKPAAEKPAAKPKAKAKKAAPADDDAAGEDDNM